MPLAAGTRLGPYEILAPVGAGGMGEVYRARDPRIGRDVAIKVLPAAFSKDEDRLRRFEQEVRAAGALNHPNILSIYDVGTHEGSPYLVSELLEGETLRQRLRGGPIPATKAIDFALETARGLAAAHEKAITHRDLKPENIFITNDGRVKILDFGLAKLTQPAEGSEANALTESVLTESGAILGTVGYMSPEQASGRAVDFRSDQFSFGAVFYEVVTGKRAFQRATSPETLSAIIREEPEPISSLTPRTAAPFRWLIERCLAKDPKERYASTGDLARELESIRSHISEFVARTEAGPRPRRRRERLAWAVAVLALATVSLWLWLGRSKPPETPTIRYLTYSGHDRSPAASPDGRTVAFCSDRDGRPRIWLKDLASGSEVALTEGPDDFPRFSPDGSMVLFTRGVDPFHASLYRVATLGGEPRKLVDDVLRSSDWSPDGRQVAFVRNFGTSQAIGVVGANGEGQREVIRVDSFPRHPRWSPDGRFIAAVQQGEGFRMTIFLVGADGKGARSLPWAPGGFEMSSPAWTGAEEVVYSQSESVGQAAVPGGTARIIRQSIASGAGQMLFPSPHNSAVLDVIGRGRVVFDAISNRQNLREFPLQGKTVSPQYRWLAQGSSQDRQPVYSPGGEWVLFTSNRSGNLDLWEMSTKTGALRRITDDPADDWDPAFTPDGKKIIWSSNRSGHFEIWMADADGSNARQVTSDGVDAEHPTMTRDGQWTVYDSGNAAKGGLWKIHPDGSGATRLVAKAFVAEVSPDGLCAVYGIPDGALRVVRTADGADMGFAAPNGRPRWMPDGHAVAFTGPDEKGVRGIFVQDFIPGQDTSKTRRKLGGFDPQMETESFGISPDGTRITISSRESLNNLMLAERVPGIAPPARKAQH